MPQVYLPFGYPRLSGLEFQNLIYQGEMVRSYTVPVDPRNDAQLVQRHLFADLSRMRGTLGAFGRAVARLTLGSRWTGVFTQIVKADVGGWWSSAVNSFEGFAELSKNAWRDAAPNKATYNDVGKIYFGVVQTMAQALLYYGSDLWGVDVWGEGDSAAATAWWTKGLPDALGYVYGRDLIRSVGWTVQGIAITGGGGGEWAYTWWSKRKLVIQFRNPSGPASITVRVNGVNRETFTVSASVDKQFDFLTNQLRQIYILKNDPYYIELWSLVKPV